MVIPPVYLLQYLFPAVITRFYSDRRHLSYPAAAVSSPWSIDPSIRLRERRWIQKNIFSVAYVAELSVEINVGWLRMDVVYNKAVTNQLS